MLADLVPLLSTVGDECPFNTVPRSDEQKTGCRFVALHCGALAQGRGYRSDAVDWRRYS